MAHSLETATEYARGVLDESIPACVYVKQAAKRFLDDLERAGHATHRDNGFKLKVGDCVRCEEFPYRFDAAKADRAIRYLENLPHIKGEWARTKQKIKLEPWQVFFVANLFGWIHRTTGKRRFRTVYAEIPRKNAKSTLASGIGLYMTTSDEEHGSEVYSLAGSKKQAFEVFGTAHKMVEKDPQMQRVLGLDLFKESIHRPKTGSRFEVLTGNPRDGSSVHCGIVDEYHEAKSSKPLQTLQTGMGARTQPLLLVITTAGYNISGPCYQLRTDSLRILDGTFSDETTFVIVFTIDKEDDPFSDAAILKANPNAGVSVSIDYLRIQRDKAVRNPSDATDYLTKHLNVWVQSRSPFFDALKWQELADPSLTIEDFKGRPNVFVGLDLAEKLDLCALSVVSEWDGKLRVLSKFYLPEKTADAQKAIPYRQLASQGFLTLTSGATTDYTVIEADLIKLNEEIKPAEFCIDPAKATFFSQNLQAKKLPIVHVNQWTKFLDEPMREVQAAIIDGRIAHDGNALMSICVANTVVKPTRQNLIKPEKEKREDKIDGVSSLVTALYRLMALRTAPPKPTPGVFSLKSLGLA